MSEYTLARTPSTFPLVVFCARDNARRARGEARREAKLRFNRRINEILGLRNDEGEAGEERMEENERGKKETEEREVGKREKL